MRFLVVAFLALCTLPSVARAQRVAVLFVATQGDDLDEGAPSIARVVSALGANVLANATLVRELEAHMPAPRSAGDTLSSVRARVHDGITAWTRSAISANDARARGATDRIDAAARDLEADPEAVEARDDNRAALREALVFVAERAIAMANPTRADDAMRRLANVDTTVAFSAREASPGVQEAYQRAVNALPRGSLLVESQPPGCDVVRDGRPAGTAPVELLDLPPGTHRIAITCGAQPSRVHRVTIAARTRATLRIDAQLDATLTTQSHPALRYATDDEATRRATQDLAAIGHILGAWRVVGVLPAIDRAVVVDVATGQRVGDALTGEAARLRGIVTPSQESHERIHLE